LYSDLYSLDYCYTLKKMMEDAVFDHPVFGVSQTSEARFTVTADAAERTVITVGGTNVVEFRMLFLSGISVFRSAAHQMGFDTLDYSSINKKIVSPHAVRLRVSSSVELYVREFSSDVFSRLFIRESEKITAENTMSRLSLLQTPIRHLQFLTIGVNVSGAPIEKIEEHEHSMMLTVYSLAEEVDVPQWVTQSFSL